MHQQWIFIYKWISKRCSGPKGHRLLKLLDFFTLSHLDFLEELRTPSVPLFFPSSLEKYFVLILSASGQRKLWVFCLFFILIHPFGDWSSKGQMEIPRLKVILWGFSQLLRYILCPGLSTSAPVLSLAPCENQGYLHLSETCLPQVL